MDSAMYMPKSEQWLNKHLFQFSNEFVSVRTYWVIYEDSQVDSILTRYNRHTFFELQFVLEGSIEQFVEDKTGQRYTFEINRNEFVIVVPGRYHQITKTDENLKKFKLAFDCEAKTPYVKELLERLDIPCKFSASEQARVYVDLMLKTVFSAAPWTSRMMTNQLECLVMELLGAVYQEYQKSAPDPKLKVNKSQQLLREVQDYIASHIEGGLKVEDISKGIGISSRHINRLCTKHLGKSLKDLIAEEKLRYIKALIETTSLSFCEMADFLGFSSEYSLNRFFKAYEGYTLSQYKKMALQ